MVIQIGNTGFRLLKSMVERKSTFFRKHFEDNRPDGKIDGQPLYKLDGNPDDFTKLWEFMEEP